MIVRRKWRRTPGAAMRRRAQPGARKVKCAISRREFWTSIGKWTHTKSRLSCDLLMTQPPKLFGSRAPQPAAKTALSSYGYATRPASQRSGLDGATVGDDPRSVRRSAARALRACLVRSRERPSACKVHTTGRRDPGVPSFDPRSSSSEESPSLPIQSHSRSNVLEPRQAEAKI